MALKKLTCETIGDLDNGLAKGMINAVLAEMYADLDDRGHDEKAREVTIKITALTKGGMTILDVQASCKLPAHRTNLTRATMHNNKSGNEPHLFFQEANAENPDQPTLPLEHGERAEGEIDP